MNHLPFDVSPVSELPYFSNKCGIKIRCKRDDLFTKAYGGSKARILQYVMANVTPDLYDVVVTAGGPNSNFNRCCALMCAELGVKMHLVEYTDNEHEYYNSLNYFICKQSNITCTRCAKSNVPSTIQLVLKEYADQGIRTKFIYGGGKSLEGIYSYYAAIEELYAQSVKVDDIFLACGTGTTLTGVCAGMQQFYPNANVHAISIARSWETEQPILDSSMSQLNSYLGTLYNFNNLSFSDKYLMGGYAQFNESLLSTIKECLTNEGIITDPTYSGKAFHGMIDTLSKNKQYFQKRNVLFLHTGGIFNYLSEKPEHN